jgi:hypothetical protein
MPCPDRQRAHGSQLYPGIQPLALRPTGRWSFKMIGLFSSAVGIAG